MSEADGPLGNAPGSRRRTHKPQTGHSLPYIIPTRLVSTQPGSSYCTEIRGYLSGSGFCSMVRKHGCGHVWTHSVSLAQLTSDGIVNKCLWVLMYSSTSLRFLLS